MDITKKKINKFRVLLSQSTFLDPDWEFRRCRMEVGLCSLSVSKVMLMFFEVWNPYLR